MNSTTLDDDVKYKIVIFILLYFPVVLSLLLALYISSFFFIVPRRDVCGEKTLRVVFIELWRRQIDITTAYAKRVDNNNRFRHLTFVYSNNILFFDVSSLKIRTVSTLFVQCPICYLLKIVGSPIQYHVIII